MVSRMGSRALVLGALSLAGCTFLTMSYVALEASGPDITYSRIPCQSPEGVPAGVRYQSGEARIEVSLEPHGLSTSKQGYLKVRAPRGQRVSIPDPVAFLTFDRGRRFRIAIEATALDWQGPFVDQMRRNSPNEEWRFVFTDLPEIEGAGTLEVPTVHVDGAAITLPTIRFERRTFAGVVPWNC